MKNLEYLDEKLKMYGTSQMYPFHMPGHKRRVAETFGMYQMDITEVEGFDNLHHAEGILKEAQERAARLYHAARTYYLVNGSTCGLLSAICACTKRNGHILIARNVHKAVYHAVTIRNLHVNYLYPTVTADGIQGQIQVSDIRRELEGNPRIEAVLITSPTYEGIVSDVAAIAAEVHAHGIPLIVDEAHGAHFGFDKRLPAPALSCGADIVVNSLHKTMLSMTQTALLHVRSELVSTCNVERFLDIFQSSSPSYVLMASIDRCVRILEQSKEELFREFLQALDRFYTQTRDLAQLHVLCEEDLTDQEMFAKDPSKIIIFVKNSDLTGKQLSDMLREEYQIELELISNEYALALSGIGDSPEGFERLASALWKIDSQLSPTECRMNDKKERSILMQRLYQERSKVMEPGDAVEMDFLEVAWAESAGKIAASYLYLYPPGIPIIVPGERLEEAFLSDLKKCQDLGLKIEGFSCNGNGIKIVN